MANVSPCARLAICHGSLLIRVARSPCACSSYRASFVNSYSSVRVRPGAPSGLWRNSSISPCEGDGPGANPGVLTNFDGPQLIGYPPPQEGEPSRARARAVRVRFPARSVSDRSRHLPIDSWRRAVEPGLSAKRGTASGFKARASRQQAGCPARFLSVAVLGWAAVLRLSIW